jgi:hypothetical protein
LRGGRERKNDREVRLFRNTTFGREKRGERGREREREVHAYYRERDSDIVSLCNNWERKKGRERGIERER